MRMNRLKNVKGTGNVKQINLLSYLNAYKDLEDANFRKYIAEFGIGPLVRANEMDDLQSLVDVITSLTKQTNIINHFYVGFKINQISKEFDLLRIGKNSIINIELKRESTKGKITKQLIQNQYYLKFLDVTIYNFTYVASTKKLYMLIDSTYITEVNFDILIEKLMEQQLKEIDNIHDLFDPINYLVSLFDSPEAFLKDEYFLTMQQSTFKKEILDIRPTENPAFIMIEGGAGTGKTLLTYDIAKEYMRNGKNVLIFQCGKLHKGLEKLRNDHYWELEPIGHFIKKQHEEAYDFSQYDVIIFDEAQRLEKSQLEKFLKSTKKAKLQCIFSLDRQHWLVSSDNNIAEFIEQQVNPKKYELKTIIRYNKEMHAFINNLFDLSKRSPLQKYSNITIQYFSSYHGAKSYLEYLRTEGWLVMDYTSSNLNGYSYDIATNRSEEDNDVLGEEYNYVAAVMDDCFYYKSNQKLSTVGLEEMPNYYPDKMLYQNIIRVRKKLHLVVIHNPELLEKILEILNNEQQ